MEVYLEDRIATATSQVIADCTAAELAAYCARLGRFDKAHKLVSTIRQRNELRPRVEVSAWIHFAEGLLAYFSNSGVSAADGVQRAYALSVAAAMRQMRALCAAWLAQWNYTRVEIDALAVHVRESLQLAAPEDHASRSRANLVVAQVLHLSGRLDLAQAWYTRAKEHATVSFDDATIGALMHNMSWQRMLLMRQAALTDSRDASAGRHALMNAESTAHFSQMIGDSSWQDLTPILRAQIVSLQGDAAQALSLYQEHLSGEKIPRRWHANLLADKAWCHASIGQTTEAFMCVAEALSSLADDTQIDDRAATHSRLAHVFSFFGNPDRASSHLGIANELWAEFACTQSKSVGLFSRIDKDGNDM